jgi:hypothetical protein
VNKGVNKSIEFKGLKAQYIWVLGGGIVGVLLLFAILYICGVNQYLCVLIAFSIGGTLIMVVSKMSHRFGEHGLMKWFAKRRLPSHLRSKSRKQFLIKS